MIPIRFQLKDSDPMPYGIHKGTLMANVPAEYLLWLYDNDKASPVVRIYVNQTLKDFRDEKNNN